MSNIYISFEFKDKTAPSSYETCTLNLLEQFEKLKTRLPNRFRSMDFNHYFYMLLRPGISCRYRMSYPDIERKQDDNARYIKNLVLRPDLPSTMSLPNDQDLILIGDIQLDGRQPYHFTCKGIELIDKAMTCSNDIVFNATTNLKFEPGRENPYTPNDIDERDNVFTPDFLQRLITQCYTIENHFYVTDYLKKWQKYLDFRDYFLEVQRQKKVNITSATYIDNAYVIDRKTYKKHASEYEDYLLDNQQDFAKTSQIVLNREVKDSEHFPLVRTYVQLNFLDYKKYEKVNKKGVVINEFRTNLYRLVRENVFLTVNNGGRNSDYNVEIRSGITLDDKYKIISYTIPPKERLEENEAEKNQEIAKLPQLAQEIFMNKAKETVENNKELIEDFDKDFRKEAEAIGKRDGDRLRKRIENKEPELLDQIYQLSLKQAAEDGHPGNESYFPVFCKTIPESVEKKATEQYIATFRQKKLSTYLDEAKRNYFDTLKGEMNLFILKEKQKIEDKYEKLAKEISWNYTDIRFAIYFKIQEVIPEKIPTFQEKLRQATAIRYDDRAEKAKITRQRRSLISLFEGYVKNPYLANYLFEPENLPPITYKTEDWTWFSKQLNEKQKEAVQKAVSSNGLSLLQGPPGTGKTEVIAETVAHLVLMGKKVLISSETHKAIDNVFDRLPKIADIVPVRLIANGKKDNEYSPERLVNNFYTNISSNMDALIRKYENFKELKEEFNERFNELTYLNDKIKREKLALAQKSENLKVLQKDVKNVNNEIALKKEIIDNLNIVCDSLKRSKKIIKSNLIFDHGLEAGEDKLFNEYFEELQQLLKTQAIKASDPSKLLSTLETITFEEANNEISLMNSDKNAGLKLEMAKIKSEMRKDEVLFDLEKSNKLRQQLIALKNQIDADDINDDDFKLLNIFERNFIDENADDIYEMICNLRQNIQDLKEKYYSLLDKEIEINTEKQSIVNKEISELRTNNNELQQKILDIKDSDDFANFESETRDLKLKIETFFKNFEIHEDYATTDEALAIIQGEWDKISLDFKSTELENKKKIPAYKKISEYLKNDDVIESDKELYTHELFDNANVFGLTCTSSDRFKKERMDDFAKYNIDDFNIKNIGIDVVIIDEVSKSSFLDLLIPILYGKTIILVGDHRQLPPMYDLGKLRHNDFDDLDDNIINYEINKGYKELYENCFFKTLFEKISPDYKTMLTKQYRCHEQIMNVFNHFYQNRLELGFPGLNNKKEHYINIWENGVNIIQPSKHTYFVDCKRHEAKEDDSTSFFNLNEALVATKLIKDIAQYIDEHKEMPKLSLGVITTYGDQAGKIKHLIKSEKVKKESFAIPGEKFIISTVDDFQGDERDIIILSMVRNPEKGARSDPEFINAYQRINVAMSRARKMLIILGSRDYLTTKGVINLPDVDGRKELDRKAFPVYKEIIATIDSEGLVLSDTDILDRKEDY